MECKRGLTHTATCFAHRNLARWVSNVLTLILSRRKLGFTEYRQFGSSHPARKQGSLELERPGVGDCTLVFDCRDVG